jgi:hypothetical protein
MSVEGTISPLMKFPRTTLFVDGIIDEVRISAIPRSATWIQTEYANQSSLGTFMSFGAEQWSAQQGAQAYFRQHLLNNSAPSATSNHTLYFTVDGDVVSQGGSATQSMVISLDPDFDLSSIDCGTWTLRSREVPPASL